jgi:hypothetical protein
VQPSRRLLDDGVITDRLGSLVTSHQVSWRV